MPAAPRVRNRGQRLAASPPRPQTLFNVRIDIADRGEKKLGLKVDEHKDKVSLRVVDVMPGGLLADLAARDPSCALMKGDRIVQVDGRHASSQELVGMLRLSDNQEQRFIELSVSRDQARAGTDEEAARTSAAADVAIRATSSSAAAEASAPAGAPPEAQAAGVSKLQRMVDSSRRRSLGNARAASAAAGAAAAAAAVDGESCDGTAAAASTAAGKSVSSPAASSSSTRSPSSGLAGEPSASASASGGSPGAGSSSAGSPGGSGSSVGSVKTVKELKGLLSAAGVDFSGCVEKADLQALWDRFEDLRAQPLASLQQRCADMGADVGSDNFSTTEACTRFLLSPDTAKGSASAAATPAASAPGTSAASCGSGSPDASAGGRARATTTAPAAAAAPAATAPASSAAATGAPARETERILGLRRNDRDPAEWAFNVLGLGGWRRLVQAEPTEEGQLHAVQKGYRTLMKTLHPDKIGQTPRVVKAVELIREARDLCERRLSRIEVPAAPCALQYRTICATPGQRRFELTWTPPSSRRAMAPVRRYVVAALDPAYGRPITISALEPDFNEELKRFVPIEELTSYNFSEVELSKMPTLWQKATCVVHVAAANEAGQSPWATLELPLSAAAAAAAAARAGAGRRVSGAAAGAAAPNWAAAGSPGGSSSGCRSPGGASSSGSSFELSPGGWGHSSSPERDEELRFEQELRQRKSADLRRWLTRQSKASIARWLRSINFSPTGTKEDLIEKVYRMAGGNA
eukprot:TRINITY_DN5177_c0_g2_i1.p1 TRINITY_DN5177_c0_g2~~TRINITY_DN5177_c0_g2_i1.p1  ORF type:complete len:762 (+),score=209.25 TRINITY_DN5177_c0_g2_i1:34-2286(+)